MWCPTDPTIYRLYEIVQVYGPALKELIHEEFGDGIMSAINFGFTVRRLPDEKRYPKADGLADTAPA